MLVKSSLYNVQSSASQSTISQKLDGTNPELAKAINDENSKRVDLSKEAVSLSKKNHAFGELNPRQEKMLELNDTK